MGLTQARIIGPRARRRIVRAGIGAALVVAVVVAVVVTTNSSHHSSATASGGPPLPPSVHTSGSITYGPNGDKRYNDQSGQLMFGMTPKHVRAAVGRPAKIVGSCWQFSVDKTIKAYGTTSTVTADRVCFAYGVFNTRYTLWKGMGWRTDNGTPVANPKQ
jgi:hypothetical protein